jgi:ribosome maturation protein SDO1
MPQTNISSPFISPPHLSPQIFSNVSKGEVANKDDLLHAFGNMDKRAILRYILDKGAMQVSEKEREAALETVLKEIASIVASKTFNPTTNLPYTVNLIQNAMKEINFSGNTTKSSKAQAWFVIKKLKVGLL